MSLIWPVSGLFRKVSQAPSIQTDVLSYITENNIQDYVLLFKNIFSLPLSVSNHEKSLICPGFDISVSEISASIQYSGGELNLL